MTTVAEVLKERRLTRMRQGNATMELIVIPSDREVRLACVPLLEVEFDEALSAVSEMGDIMGNAAALSRQDRRYTRELLVRALRNANNLEERAFESVDELQKSLESTDIDHCIDVFNELTANANPSIDGISEEEFASLKELLQEINWSGLSGRSWFAAKRFLGALISDGLLRGNLPGSSSIAKSTSKSE